MPFRPQPAAHPAATASAVHDGGPADDLHDATVLFEAGNWTLAVVAAQLHLERSFEDRDSEAVAAEAAWPRTRRALESLRAVGDWSTADDLAQHLDRCEAIVAGTAVCHRADAVASLHVAERLAGGAAS